MSAQSFLKHTALAALRKSGAFPAIGKSPWRNHRLLILCYHGICVSDEHEWLGSLYITPDRFRRRLQALRASGANVLPLGEAADRLRRKSLPPRSVVLTFDDGLAGFDRAVPVLHEFGYPCTLYLTTHYCQHPVPVITLILNYLLWKSGKKHLDLPGYLPSPAAIGTPAERQTAVKAILTKAVADGLGTLAKDELARSLAERLQVDYDEILRSRMLQIMRPEEVTAAARAGIDIQLHTHRHRVPRDRGLFLREIEDNRDRILEYTGRRPVHFCYPSGEYAMEFLPWLKAAGVESATTCEAGLASRASDPLLLPRILDDGYIGDIEFESWVYGLRI